MNLKTVESLQILVQLGEAPETSIDEEIVTFKLTIVNLVFNCSVSTDFMKAVPPICVVVS